MNYEVFYGKCNYLIFVNLLKSCLLQIMFYFWLLIRSFFPLFQVTVVMSARLRNLNPYELHKHLVNVYSLNTRGSTSFLKRDASRDRTDLDVIRENHKFLWEEDEVADSWEKQLAKKYYDKLFKEYCICDLTRYKENKVSLSSQLYKEPRYFISGLLLFTSKYM